MFLFLMLQQAVALLRSLFPDWNPPHCDEEECATCDVGRHILREQKLEIERRINEEKVCDWLP